ncbi:MAG TPA: hypothetical protein VD970_08165 [Acetobacteraceae bacterium]|nr:hypothetical protein [Acetobacteraceae bacterium]
MTPILQSFPRRALTLKPGRGRIAALMTALGGLVFAGGISAWMAMAVVPPILTDWQVRETAEAAREARLVSGRCRARLFLFQDCDVTLSYTGKGQSVRREVHYVFVSPGRGNFTVQARVDPMQPQLLTTDLGIEHLINRTVTAGAFWLFGLAIGLGLLLAARRAMRDAGAVRALSGRPLAPAPAQFLGWGHGPSWTVRDEFGNAFTWPVRKRDRPFVLDPARGLVLTLREAPGSPAFPLDEKLRLVDLTDGERHQVLAARAAMGLAPRPG